MADSVTESTELDLTFDKRPTRSAYVTRQALRSLIYVCYALLLFFLAIIWSLMITFSILPIICIRRGWRKVPEYYIPVFRVQHDVFRAYKASVQQDRLMWDFEMGKPQPIGLQQRSFRSSEGKTLTQSHSSPLLNLPAELRLQIYREVIVGDGPCVRISTHRRRRPRGKRHIYKTRCQFSEEDQLSGEHPDQAPAYDCDCFRYKQSDISGDGCPKALPRHPGRGVLALSKTCRQIYVETVDLLYSLPIFRFDFPHHPPFFLRRVLSHRLALIKHIQICLSTPYMGTPCMAHEGYDRFSIFEHRLQRCSRCNIRHWLDTIRSTMHGLERIDVLVHIDTDIPVPSAEEPWVRHILSLQHDDNRLRQLRIYVYPVKKIYELYKPVFFLRQRERSPQVESIDETLQNKIKRGAETYKRVVTDTTAGNPAPEVSS